MDFTSRRIVAPTIDAVTVNEARDYLEQPGTDADAKITRAIRSAVNLFERHTRRALMLQTWLFETSADDIPLELPRPPFVDIVTCQSRDEPVDAWVEVDAADYVLESERSPARLTWIAHQPPHVRITYRCGAADRCDIPSDYVTSVLQLVTFLFENRGDAEAKLPISIVAMLDEQRSGTLFNYFRP